ncbi:phenylalanine--tRNA ligase subunit beta [Proteiniclasticum sp. BAD-10]|uniref:Phenylalanine--tRNA ligase beta subunit n=1 Tax=Proteiniclasticum sediminis TaxID=2804028 RepID=A0A941HQ78_9CLOT|nr:phenylalanine--tRNA ligase subunit beta [Proteiniclasticum sediminis]MBR0574872.1 phenylalanine--tRNA ligase subunit beta [Proteiniclasticum sediminis]
MKLPIRWLKDYVKISTDSKTLAEDYTLSGSMVEGLENPFAVIQNVYTSRILSVEKHPEADKLFVCQIDLNRGEPTQIVTAATNMKEGDIVPAALHNSTLWGGTSIKRGKLRGVLSDGMFCSEEELGLKEEGTCDGLMILPETTPIGIDIKTALGLDGGILDLEITSNRPDCLSILGLAREASAMYRTPLEKPRMDYPVIPADGEAVKVELDTPLVRRYMARELVNVKIGESPEWMKQRLLEAGIRPISNLVDITNFVMLELGQPMHAFDKREITSGTIRVKEAAGGETFTTLDENERTLRSKTLLICDEDKIIGLAGLMGGLDSEIRPDTSRVIIESANFDGVTIRTASSYLNLRTEASSRFDKDIDPNLVELAMDRLCHLVTALGVGQVLDYTVDVYPAKRTPNTLTVSVSDLNQFLGTHIPGEEMTEILTYLEVEVRPEGDLLHLTTPTFRNDLAIREDIAEEVVRIYGYNRVPATLPHVNAPRGGRYPHQILRKKLEGYLAAQGLFESISYSFIARKDLDKVLTPEDSPLRQMVEIRNPLGEDFSVMRTTTRSTMMESLKRNQNRGNAEAALYELGKVYLKSEGEVLPREKEVLTVGRYGQDLFFHLKGIVEILAEEFGLKDLSYQRSKSAFFHPGKAAEALLGKSLLASFGEVHPKVLSNYGLDQNCYFLELDVELLFASASITKKYTEIPKYPSVTRDLAVLVDDSVLVQDLEKIFSKQGGSLLESYALFDVYKGAQLPPGKKSVAYNLVYRNKEKTLTDKDVAKVHDKIVRSLEYQLGAVLR